jgi:TRAP-type C4-dicarboxylate transport system substrate-binding protein
MLMVGMAGIAAAQPKIELRAATYFATTHQLYKSMEDFLKKIEERSGGRVKMNIFAGNTLLGAKEIYDGVVKGVADIGMTMIGYTAGRFPEMEFLELPHSYPSSYVSSHVTNDYFSKYKPKEFDQTQMLYWFVSPPSVLILTKPVNTLEELKGKKVRGTARVGDVLTALGAVPQSTVAGEVFTSMSRGVIDGIMWPYETLFGWKLGELKPHVTSCWQVGGVYAFYTVMNKDTWNKLPDDIKKIIRETSEEWKEKHALAYLQIDIEGLEYQKKLGGKIIELSSDEIPKWKKAVSPVIGAYVKEMAGKGYSEIEMKEKTDFIASRVEFWTKKQKEAGIKAPTGGN